MCVCSQVFSLEPNNHVTIRHILSPIHIKGINPYFQTPCAMLLSCQNAAPCSNVKKNDFSILTCPYVEKNFSYITCTCKTMMQRPSPLSGWPIYSKHKKTHELRQTSYMCVTVAGNTNKHFLVFSHNGANACTKTYACCLEFKIPVRAPVCERLCLQEALFVRGSAYMRCSACERLCL